MARHSGSRSQGWRRHHRGKATASYEFGLMRCSMRCERALSGSTCRQETRCPKSRWMTIRSSGLHVLGGEVVASSEVQRQTLLPRLARPTADACRHRPLPGSVSQMQRRPPADASSVDWPGAEEGSRTPRRRSRAPEGDASLRDRTQRSISSRSRPSTRARSSSSRCATLTTTASVRPVPPPSHSATSRLTPWRQLEKAGVAIRVLSAAASAPRSVFLKNESIGRAPISSIGWTTWTAPIAALG
jgi:hypothetical protein